MKKLAVIFLISLLITSCSSSDSSSESSILNGKWATECDSTSIVNGLAGSISNKRVMTFQDGVILNQIYLYSDSACSVLDSTQNNGLFGGLFVGYTIGKSTTSSNGATVREIDFINVSKDLLPDIFLLLNSSELYFGIKEQALMVQCQSADDSPFQNTPSCWTVRPIEINYNEVFTKLPE